MKGTLKNHVRDLKNQKKKLEKKRKYLNES